MERADTTFIFGGREVLLIVTKRARLHYLESDLVVKCGAGDIHGELLRGPVISIRSYGECSYRIMYGLCHDSRHDVELSV